MLYPCIICVAMLMDLFGRICICVCELFGKTIRNMFGCGSYFVVECCGMLSVGKRCSVG